MRHDQGLELSEQLAVAPQLEVDLDPFDRRGEALLLEPRPLAVEQCVRAGSVERRATPDTERLLDLQPRRLQPTGPARLPSPVHRRRPAVDIPCAGTEPEGI